MGVLLICMSSCGNDKDSKDQDASQKDTKKQEFSDFYYYEKENEDRYEAYKDVNPDIENGDIVWQVNADLDKEFYDDSKETEDIDSPLVIVNKYNYVPESYIPENLKSVGNGMVMREDAADAFLEMLKGAEADDIQIVPRTGYRNYDFQRTLYESYKAKDPENVDTYSARPGYSEHHTGLAIDMTVSGSQDLQDFVGTKEAEWVYANCHNYGFIVRYTEDNKEITGFMDEPWHIRYIGVKHAKKMVEENISSYEEYKVKFVDHEPTE